MSRKYYEIKAFLKAEALKTESRLRMPTIAELMRRFHASQSPVSRAVHDLEREGVLYCRRGAGIVSRSGSAPFTVKPPAEVKRRGEVAFFSIDYFANTIWEMEHTLNAYAQQLGYTARNYRLQRDSDRIGLLRSTMGAEELRGVVLMSSADRLEPELIELLSKLPCPAVILDSYFHYDSLPGNVSLLMPDAKTNGRNCVEYFHAAGHRSIGFVRSAPDGSIPQQMIAGALEAAEERDMEFTVLSCAIKSWESNCDAGRNITRNSLDIIRSRQITGLIYIGPSSTIAGRRVLWENGIRVPDEVSLLSHGNDSLLGDCIPALTSTKTDFTAMSRDALDIVAGGLPRQELRLYPAEIIERESIASR